MDKKLLYTFGVAAIVLTLGSVALAAAPIVPGLKPLPSPAAPPAPPSGDTTWTTTAAPTMMPDNGVQQGTDGYGMMQFQGAPGGGQVMMNRGYGGYGGGFHSRMPMRAGDGHGGYANERGVGLLFPLVALAGLITLLLGWTVLVLLIIALTRHLRKKQA